jgi:hypothetical protein
MGYGLLSDSEDTKPPQVAISSYECQNEMSGEAFIVIYTV